MASAQAKQAGRKTKTRRVDGFDVREASNGAWEVFELASGKPVRISGNQLTSLSEDEARGAIHLLKAEAIRPDQPR